MQHASEFLYLFVILVQPQTCVLISSELDAFFGNVSEQKGIFQRGVHADIKECFSFLF